MSPLIFSLSIPVDRLNLFLYLYETNFIKGLLKKNEKKLAKFFNLPFIK